MMTSAFSHASGIRLFEALVQQDEHCPLQCLSTSPQHFGYDPVFSWSSLVLHLAQRSSQFRSIDFRYFLRPDVNHSGSLSLGAVRLRDRLAVETFIEVLYNLCDFFHFSHHFTSLISHLVDDQLLFGRPCSEDLYIPFSMVVFYDIVNELLWFLRSADRFLHLLFTYIQCVFVYLPASLLKCNFLCAEFLIHLSSHRAYFPNCYPNAVRDLVR